MTADQVEALLRLASDPERVFWETEAVLNKWLSFKEGHANTVKSWRADLLAHKQSVVGKLDPVVLQALLHEARHPDVDFLQDLLQGFPVTGIVGVGGLGTDVPGGLLSRGRRSVTGPLSLQALRASCRTQNAATVRRALSRVPQTPEEYDVAQEVWQKTKTDIEMGRAGEPLELDDVDLDDVLLAEVFGILEQHGNAAKVSVRGIHNFRANFVNECAVMPQKLRYDGFDQMLGALGLMAKTLREAGIPLDIHMGKADLKSAVKTLPTGDS